MLANGLNVYPEDIENVLLTHPAIKDAIVIGLMEKGKGPTVYAILLMEDPAQAHELCNEMEGILSRVLKAEAYAELDMGNRAIV